MMFCPNHSYDQRVSQFLVVELISISPSLKVKNIAKLPYDNV